MVKNLKMLRERKGISQKRLADAIRNVTQQSIHKYEQLNIEPDIQTLIKLADFFDTSVDYLIGHTHIEHTIESALEYKMTDEEVAMIDDYRKLTPKQRESINALIKSIIEE